MPHTADTATSVVLDLTVAMLPVALTPVLLGPVVVIELLRISQPGRGATIGKLGASLFIGLGRFAYVRAVGSVSAANCLSSSRRGS